MKIERYKNLEVLEASAELLRVVCDTYDTSKLSFNVSFSVVWIHSSSIWISVYPELQY